jgi:predicted small lipoprotein YifL
MKTFWTLVASLILIGLAGCGDKASTEAEKAAKAAEHSYDQAPAPLKEKYLAVASAVQSGDFPAAKAGLDQLSQAQLSPEQEQALADQRNKLMIKLSTAAQNGDANAGKMIQELRYQGRARSR